MKQNVKIQKLSKKIDNIIPPPVEFKDNYKPVPTPRKSIKQMVQDYEDNIIQPPTEFRDDYKPVPAPRKSVKQMAQDYEDNIIQPRTEFRDDYKPIPLPRTKKQVPLLRTKIERTDKALKGISIKNNKDPLVQLQNTRKAIEHHIRNILESMKGLKFVETLKMTFKKLGKNGTLNKTAYFNSKRQTIINNTEIPEASQLTKQQILNKIAVWISDGSGWTIESVDNHYLNIVQYQPMKGSIRHLNPQDRNPQRIKKSDKEHIDKLDYSGIEFPVTTKQYNKIEKQNEININVFGYENKQPLLLLITENDNKHYVLIKDFNRFMFNQTKYEGKKLFCMHCPQCFSSERVLNNHKDNCIQVNGTQAVKMPDKNNNILKFNNFHKQQPVPFVIYADFEAITEKISSCQPNDDKSCTEAYQKHTDCGYGYKIVCCYDDKYSKPATTYRG